MEAGEIVNKQFDETVGDGGWILDRLRVFARIGLGAHGSARGARIDQRDADLGDLLDLLRIAFEQIVERRLGRAIHGATAIGLVFIRATAWPDCGAGADIDDLRMAAVKVAKKYNVTIGNIVRRPIDGLIEYHRNYLLEKIE